MKRLIILSLLVFFIVCKISVLAEGVMLKGSDIRKEVDKLQEIGFLRKYDRKIFDLKLKVTHFDAASVNITSTPEIMFIVDNIHKVVVLTSYLNVQKYDYLNPNNTIKAGNTVVLENCYYDWTKLQEVIQWLFNAGFSYFIQQGYVYLFW